jgi:hypothetical protein
MPKIVNWNFHMARPREVGGRELYTNRLIGNLVGTFANQYAQKQTNEALETVLEPNPPLSGDATVSQTTQDQPGPGPVMPDGSQMQTASFIHGEWNNLERKHKQDAALKVLKRNLSPAAYARVQDMRRQRRAMDALNESRGELATDLDKLVEAAQESGVPLTPEMEAEINTLSEILQKPEVDMGLREILGIAQRVTKLGAERQTLIKRQLTMERAVQGFNALKADLRGEPSKRLTLIEEYEAAARAGLMEWDEAHRKAMNARHMSQEDLDSLHFPVGKQTPAGEGGGGLLGVPKKTLGWILRNQPPVAVPRAVAQGIADIWEEHGDSPEVMDFLVSTGMIDRLPIPDILKGSAKAQSAARQYESLSDDDKVSLQDDLVRIALDPSMSTEEKRAAAARRRKGVAIPDDVRQAISDAVKLQAGDNAARNQGTIGTPIGTADPTQQQQPQPMPADPTQQQQPQPMPADPTKQQQPQPMPADPTKAQQAIQMSQDMLRQSLGGPEPPPSPPPPPDPGDPELEDWVSKQTKILRWQYLETEDGERIALFGKEVGPMGRKYEKLTPMQRRWAIKPADWKKLTKEERREWAMEQYTPVWKPLEFPRGKTRRRYAAKMNRLLRHNDKRVEKGLPAIDRREYNKWWMDAWHRHNAQNVWKGEPFEAQAEKTPPRVK